MTELHPITPSPELIEEWIELSRLQKNRPPNPNVLATYAARWGSDQELEACCEWLNDYMGTLEAGDLREIRRPKPKSLQDQALDDLERIAALLMKNNLPCDTGNIRRALEALPDD